MGLVQKAFSDIITFSRSSNATRVGPTGLVEYAPHNLILQSQTFDNASWTKLNGTITANSVAAPDGTVTADTLVEDTSTGAHQITQAYVAASGTVVTFSVYVKQSQRSWMRITVNTASGANASAYFDVSAGTVGAVGGGTASITSVSGGWFRCSITGTLTTTNPTLAILLANGNNGQSYTGDGTSGIYIWGAQLAVGSLPLDYTPTTTAAVYGPRFDYDPVTLAARGLLIEEQRTNLLTYSEDLTNASWSKTFGGAGLSPVIFSNQTVAPDGTLTADYASFDCVGSSSSDRSTLVRSLSVTSGAAYTFSFWIKAVTPSDIGKQLRVFGDSMLTSTIVTIPATWERMSFSGTASITTPNCGIETRGTYTTNTTANAYIWGAQFEAGGFATSYIPTVAATVTRSADVASVNTLSPWFNATEGTLYAECDSAASGTNTISAFDDNTANENIRLRNVGTDPKFTVTDGGVDQCDINGGTIVARTVFKFAGAYKANDFAACVNGGSVATDTSGTLPTVDRLRLGTSQAGNYLNGHLRRVAYYPRRLLDAELQTLTA